MNGEITRIIMLRESGIIPSTREAKDCDCGILGEIVDGLNKVANDGGDAAGSDAAASTEAPAAGKEYLIKNITSRQPVLNNHYRRRRNESSRRINHGFDDH